MNESYDSSSEDVFIIEGMDVSAKNPDDILINYQSNPFFSLLRVDALSVIAVRKIAQWTDPFTLPQTKLDCVKECSITPWDKFCCGWALRKKFMQVEAFVEVRTKTDQDIIRALEGCLQEAAISAAIAAIVASVFTGGAALPAAEAAFIAVLTPCLERKLQDIVSVRIYTSSHWGDWQ